MTLTTSSTSDWDYYIQVQPCMTCGNSPCTCWNNYCYTYTYPSYPGMSGIEEKLDKIIKLLEPDGLEEYRKEISDELHKELLAEALEKFEELFKSLGEK